MKFRTATAADLDGIVALHRQLQPDDPVVDGRALSTRFAEILAQPGCSFTVADSGARLEGSIYLNIIPNLTRGTRPYAVIENVIVDARLRGTGIGTQLMAAAVERARCADCYKVMLLTGSTNAATHGFYRACGFDGEAKHAYLHRLDTP